MKRRAALGALAAGVLLAAAAAAQPASPAAGAAIHRMSLAAGSAVRAVASDRTGLVRFLATEPGRPIPLRAAGGAEARARAFLGSFGEAFGVRGADDLVALRVGGADEVGMEHVRLQQLHQGIPIAGAELTVHLRGAAVVAVNARTLAVDAVDVTPVLSGAAAADAARALIARKTGGGTAELSEPRLEILDRQLFDRRARGPARLAWFIEARAFGLREYLWIDARDGRRLLQFSQLAEARDREVYDAESGSALPGTLARSEGEAATSDADVDAAYDFSGDTYDYYFAEFGRDSYDGAGATLVSSVYYCSGACPYANAFWDGAQMVYGEGYALDDVTAHELTHAVTERTANLYYYMQSGALSESYSDIFGEAVDLGNGAGTDTMGVRWLIGEDLPGGAIRDMMDPTAYFSPGKMSDTPEFFCDGSQADSGGVHYNSGVPNHAFALMVDGGSYNGFVVGALGLAKAAKIEYRALTLYLTSASDFLDNYNALGQACQDLIGTAGISAADCVEVGDALDAVEMADPWPCTDQTPVPEPAYCPAGQAPSMLIFFDFEAALITACPADDLPTTWCQNGPASVLGPFATSGEGSLWAYDKPALDTQTLTVNLSGMLPPGVRVQFAHAHGFDSETGPSVFWDGGVFEYSTDDRVTWSDAAGLFVAGEPYGGAISTASDNPLEGRDAFVAESWGYTASQYDLSGLENSEVDFRFRLASDSFPLVDDYGWFLDDLALYTCSACVENRTLDSTYNGTASLYQASNSIIAGGGFSVGVAESVSLEAGSVVRLDNGFTVAGGDLTVALDPSLCP